mmetsp:Transcript_20348/g.64710  ORF Transcript_20348/g.64710 Transcript_20348/m.64710 type:complete len:368 (-) Transcript_20348:74-1177(-)
MCPPHECNISCDPVEEITDPLFGCDGAAGCCGAPSLVNEDSCSCSCWKCGEEYSCSVGEVDKFLLDRPFEHAKLFHGREGKRDDTCTPTCEEECTTIPALMCASSCGSCLPADGAATVVALKFEGRWVPIAEFMVDPKGREGIIEVERGFSRDRVTLQILALGLYSSAEDKEAAARDEAGKSRLKDLGGESSDFKVIPSDMGACIAWVKGRAAGFYTFAMADNRTFADNFWPVPALACCAVRPSFRRRGLGRRMVADFYRGRAPARLEGDSAVDVTGIHLPVSNVMLHTLAKELSSEELNSVMLLKPMVGGRVENYSGCTLEDLKYRGRNLEDQIGKHRSKVQLVKSECKNAIRQYKADLKGYWRAN